jgi:type I restriction enzyme S subunit
MSITSTLGEVCESIVYGVTVSAEAKLTGPRLLRITDITSSGVNWNSVPGCSISAQENEKAKLIDGDIVVARTGGTVGKSFLLTNPPDAVCASYLLRLRPDKSKILPAYLHLFLRSGSYWDQLLAAAQGAAQPNVNGTTLSEIELSVPDFDTQAAIVGDLIGQLEQVDKMRAALESQLADIEVLPRKLLSNVF